MEMTDVCYEKNGHIARIVINRPPMNALTANTLDELKFAFKDASRDRSIGVIVFTHTGDRAFCVGADVKWARQEGGIHNIGAAFRSFHEAMRACYTPVICRIDGYAIGAGNHIAYCCDFTICSDRSVFGQNGPRVGSLAEGESVSYLVNVVGSKKAREIWMLCRKYNGPTAEKLGLVNASVAPEALDDEVAQWCDEILRLSPTCLKVLKATFESEHDRLRQPEKYFGSLIAPEFETSEEMQEAINAFVEKRPANFYKYLTDN